MPDPDPTYVRTADLWSRVGLFASLGLGLALAVADVSFLATGREEFIAGPVHSLCVGLIVAVVVCSVVARVVLPVLRAQRQVLARLDALETRELNGRVVQMGDRIGEKLIGSR